MGLEQLKNAVDDKRKIFDDQRAAVDEIRKTNQIIQRA
jgi:hypothetical protein